MQTNLKGQNLIHVLARNAHLINDVNEIIKFYKQLQERGLRADAKDDKGKTALHHAVRA
jgi:ankyrin repeat protein